MLNRPYYDQTVSPCTTITLNIATLGFTQDSVINRLGIVIKPPLHFAIDRSIIDSWLGIARQSLELKKNFHWPNKVLLLQLHRRDCILNLSYRLAILHLALVQRNYYHRPAAPPVFDEVIPLIITIRAIGLDLPVPIGCC